MADAFEDVINECLELRRRKSADYQNAASNIKQADHYRRGIDSIHDIIHQKVLRAQSLLESGSTPNNESLEDTYKDLCNYSIFAVMYLRGTMKGQDPEKDAFNKKTTTYSAPTLAAATKKQDL